MLQALVIFFLAMGALEVLAIAIGKANLMGGLVVVCLAVFFAGVLYALGGLQKDVRALTAYLRESAARPPGARPPR